MEAIEDRKENDSPASTQQEADEEALAWGHGQWLANTTYIEPQWPHDIAEGLVEMALEHLTKAAMTFPNGTGLGWGGLHPRALLRLSPWLLK